MYLPNSDWCTSTALIICVGVRVMALISLFIPFKMFRLITQNVIPVYNCDYDERMFSVFSLLSSSSTFNQLLIQNGR